MFIKIWEREKKKQGKQKALDNKYNKHPSCITALTKQTMSLWQQ